MEKNQNSYMMQRLDELQQIPEWYPHHFSVSMSLMEYKQKYDFLKPDEILFDVTESVAGRIQFIRTSGSKLYFADLESNEVTLQILSNVMYRENKAEFDMEKKIIKRGDVVGVIGYPTRSSKGELSIIPKKVILLAPCLHPIPKNIDGLSDVGLRFQKRYLDLMLHHDKRKIFKTRSNIMKYIRNFLDDRDYIEVETPILSVKVGGANAKPFITHHNDFNKEMFMRIAPELYLKQLVIGGLERVYELGKQFRNEGIDQSHNPEFTSIELYQAYADYNDMMMMTEQFFSALVLKNNGSHILSYDLVNHTTGETKNVNIDFSPPFQKLDFIKDLQLHGKFEFPPEVISDLGNEMARQFLIKLCDERNINCADPKTTPRLLDKLVGTYLEPLCHNPTFIINHPQIMSPLAKYHRDDRNLTERFELFILGTEYANAYTELNDPRIQKICFEKQAMDKSMGDVEAQPTDNDFVTAMEHGLPPTGGLGIGIDRLIMLLTNQNSIKEVITFQPC